MRGKIKLLITLEQKTDVSLRDLRAYIKDAIETWGGQFPPEDQLFYTTKVKGVRKAP